MIVYRPRKTLLLNTKLIYFLSIKFAKIRCSNHTFLINVLYYLKKKLLIKYLKINKKYENGYVFFKSK